VTATIRRLVFTAHIASSLGWLGAVCVFLGLAGLGLASQQEATVRAAYLVMAPAAWITLVPLAHAALFSGVAISLGTPWGLLRHYWVVAKLALTLVSTIVLMIYMETFREMAGVAADPIAELHLVRNPSPLVHGVLALGLLMTATILSVYKPFGMTTYGLREQQKRSPNRNPERTISVPPPPSAAAQFWTYAIWILAGTGILLVAAHTVLGGGAHHH
jgi:hypothetical protein